MTSFTDLLQQGPAHAWLFIPSAILLGALHGLEPGHSKTMMAAFIVAIRGSVAQAALLGLSATVSHTAVVWLVAFVGIYFFGGKVDAEATEPYFLIVSGILIVAISIWMLRRTWLERQQEHAQKGGSRDPHGDHDHHHAHNEVRDIVTTHGVIRLEIFEDGVPPRFRVRLPADRKASLGKALSVAVETERADGRLKRFTFVDRGEFLESSEEIPEPHEFVARLELDHQGHAHDYDVEFVEAEHAHAVADYKGLDVSAPGYQDAHELAHANDIRRRFSNKSVTTGQIVVFGLTGGLIPCPASITVLLLCLQLKRIALGVTLVLAFSVGLALTMVTAGVVAALSVRQLAGRFSGFGAVARYAPYASSAIIICVGLLSIRLGLAGFHG